MRPIVFKVAAWVFTGTTVLLSIFVGEHGGFQVISPWIPAGITSPSVEPIPSVQPPVTITPPTTTVTTTRISRRTVYRTQTEIIDAPSTRLHQSRISATPRSFRWSWISPTTDFMAHVDQINQLIESYTNPFNFLPPATQELNENSILTLFFNLLNIWFNITIAWGFIRTVVRFGLAEVLYLRPGGPFGHQPGPVPHPSDVNAHQPGGNGHNGGDNDDDDDDNNSKGGGGGGDEAVRALAAANADLDARARNLEQQEALYRTRHGILQEREGRLGSLEDSYGMREEWVQHAEQLYNENRVSQRPPSTDDRETDGALRYLLILCQLLEEWNRDSPEDPEVRSLARSGALRLFHGSIQRFRDASAPSEQSSLQDNSDLLRIIKALGEARTQTSAGLESVQPNASELLAAASNVNRSLVRSLFDRVWGANNAVAARNVARRARRAVQQEEELVQEQARASSHAPLDDDLSDGELEELQKSFNIPDVDGPGQNTASTQPSALLSSTELRRRARAHADVFEDHVKWDDNRNTASEVSQTSTARLVESRGFDRYRDGDPDSTEQERTEQQKIGQQTIEPQPAEQPPAWSNAEDPNTQELKRRLEEMELRLAQEASRTLSERHRREHAEPQIADREGDLEQQRTAHDSVQKLLKHERELAATRRANEAERSAQEERMRTQAEELANSRGRTLRIEQQVSQNLRQELDAEHSTIAALQQQITGERNAAVEDVVGHILDIAVDHANAVRDQQAQAELQRKRKLQELEDENLREREAQEEADKQCRLQEQEAKEKRRLEKQASDAQLLRDKQAADEKLRHDEQVAKDKLRRDRQAAEEKRLREAHEAEVRRKAEEERDAQEKRQAEQQRVAKQKRKNQDNLRREKLEAENKRVQNEREARLQRLGAMRLPAQGGPQDAHGPEREANAESKTTKDVNEPKTETDAGDHKPKSGAVQGKPSIKKSDDAVSAPAAPFLPSGFNPGQIDFSFTSTGDESDSEDVTTNLRPTQRTSSSAAKRNVPGRSSQETAQPVIQPPVETTTLAALGVPPTGLLGQFNFSFTPSVTGTGPHEVPTNLRSTQHPFSVAAEHHKPEGTSQRPTQPALQPLAQPIRRMAAQNLSPVMTWEPSRLPAEPAPQLFVQSIYEPAAPNWSAFQRPSRAVAQLQGSDADKVSEDANCTKAEGEKREAPEEVQRLNAEAEEARKAEAESRQQAESDATDDERAIKRANVLDLAEQLAEQDEDENLYSRLTKRERLEQDRFFSEYDLPAAQQTEIEYVYDPQAVEQAGIEYTQPEYDLEVAEQAGLEYTRNDDFLQGIRGQQVAKRQEHQSAYRDHKNREHEATLQEREDAFVRREQERRVEQIRREQEEEEEEERQAKRERDERERAPATEESRIDAEMRALEKDQRDLAAMRAVMRAAAGLPEDYVFECRDDVQSDADVQQADGAQKEDDAAQNAKSEAERQHQEAVERAEKERQLKAEAREYHRLAREQDARDFEAREVEAEEEERKRIEEEQQRRFSDREMRWVQMEREDVLEAREALAVVRAVEREVEREEERQREEQDRVRRQEEQEKELQLQEQRRVQQAEEQERQRQTREQERRRQEEQQRDEAEKQKVRLEHFAATGCYGCKSCLKDPHFHGRHYERHTEAFLSRLAAQSNQTQPVTSPKRHRPDSVASHSSTVTSGSRRTANDPKPASTGSKTKSASQDDSNEASENAKGKQKTIKAPGHVSFDREFFESAQTQSKQKYRPAGRASQITTSNALRSGTSVMSPTPPTSELSSTQVTQPSEPVTETSGAPSFTERPINDLDMSDVVEPDQTPSTFGLQHSQAQSFSGPIQPASTAAPNLAEASATMNAESLAQDSEMAGIEQTLPVAANPPMNEEQDVDMEMSDASPGQLAGQYSFPASDTPFTFHHVPALSNVGVGRPPHIMGSGSDPGFGRFGPRAPGFDRSAVDTLDDGHSAVDTLGFNRSPVDSPGTAPPATPQASVPQVVSSEDAEMVESTPSTPRTDGFRRPTTRSTNLFIPGQVQYKKPRDTLLDYSPATPNWTAASTPSTEGGSSSLPVGIPHPSSRNLPPNVNRNIYEGGLKWKADEEKRKKAAEERRRQAKEAEERNRPLQQAEERQNYGQTREQAERAEAMRKMFEQNQTGSEQMDYSDDDDPEAEECRKWQALDNANRQPSTPVDPMLQKTRIAQLKKTNAGRKALGQQSMEVDAPKKQPGEKKRGSEEEPSTQRAEAPKADSSKSYKVDPETKEQSEAERSRRQADIERTRITERRMRAVEWARRMLPRQAHVDRARNFGTYERREATYADWLFANDEQRAEINVIRERMRKKFGGRDADARWAQYAEGTWGNITWDEWLQDKKPEGY